MSERVALLLFRLAARAFPAELRASYGDEMRESFLEAYRRRARGRRRYLLRATADVLHHGLSERWRHRQVPTATRRRSVGTFWQDVRYGARSLFRNPGFTAVAVLTLGLGIGANAAIFSVVHAVLLNPLPFREPERLVSLWETRLDRGFDQATFSRANFWDVQEQNRTFSGIGAMEYTNAVLTGAGSPEQLTVSLVSAEFFQILGVEPRLGSGFRQGDDLPGGTAQTSVLLGHDTWVTRFGSDPKIVGRSITLDGQPYTVIGVLPRGEPWLDEADVYRPMTHRPDMNRGSWELMTIGRLKPGVTMEAAQEDLNAIARRLGELYPTDDKGMGVSVTPSTRWIAPDSTRRALWILMGSVGFLLLIACVNLANLFLARATGRSRERALRAALGASRGRIVRQVLTESLVVSAVGAVGGLGLAFGIIKLLLAWNPAGVPRLSEVGINGWVLGFTALITVVTALLSGSIPALQSTRGDLAGTLREGERNVGGGRFLGRLRAGLVAIEVAASLALLIGAGLLLRSFREVLAQDRGFTTEHRVLANVALPRSYRAEGTARILFELRGKLLAHPEITSVAMVSIPPLNGVGTGMGFAAADNPDQFKETPWAGWRIITKDYFRTLGVPIVAGRDFTEHDIISRPWRVIISKRTADMLWPGQNAVGRTLIMWKGQSNDPAEVIGVAGDMRDWGLGQDQSLSVYFPYYGAGARNLPVVIHTRADPAAVQRMLRAALNEIDSSLPLGEVRSMEDLVGSSVASRRFIMMLLAAFAGVALILALAGIYGVLSYAVSRRTAEIGVRLALGANPLGVLGLIVAQGMKPVVIGVVIGIVAAALLTKLMTTLLFGVSAIDVVTYAGVAGLLGGAALVSCYVPARQALKVDVVAALRKE